MGRIRDVNSTAHVLFHRVHFFHRSVPPCEGELDRFFYVEKTYWLRGVRMESKTVSRDDYAVGIDLGTTYSCVAVLRNGRVDIIANDVGSKTTPSVVAFTDSDRLVGEAALNQASANAKNTIYDTKRMLGRSFDDHVLQSDLPHWVRLCVFGFIHRMLAFQSDGEARQAHADGRLPRRTSVVSTRRDLRGDSRQTQSLRRGVRQRTGDQGRDHGARLL